MMMKGTRTSIIHNSRNWHCQEKAR